MKFRLAVLVGMLLSLFVFSSGARQTKAKIPDWQPNEHPRLIASPAEKNAIIAKLTTPGTASATIWQDFQTNNFKDHFRDYADAAFSYWITGNTADGQQAIQTAQNWMTTAPYGINPSGGTFNESWFNYLDLLLTYDFAYDLLTSQQKASFENYIAMQGSRCEAANPGYDPGNINVMWMFCEYASAMLLPSQTMTIHITDEDIWHTFSNTADKLSFPTNNQDFKISDSPGSPTNDYTQGVDYFYRATGGCTPLCLDWSPSGAGIKEPGFAQHYYVSYTFNVDTSHWKGNARVAFENHLNYEWHDGYYNGGLNPYGNVVAEELPFLIEMIRRDTGVDYSQDPDVKRIVDMYIYSQLPSTPAGVTRRFNTINDTGGWTSYDADALLYPSQSYDQYRSWLRPFLAWGTSQYANDPEGYGQRYLWEWARAYRNPDGTIAYDPAPDWREALWINNAAVQPYLGTTATPTATWPLTRYFRGKEVIYARTDDWNHPNSQAALMSMVSGNHNYENEHDQGDAGSFTFFSLGEDWGIDPGYANGSAGASLVDHNSVGIDGAGYVLSGAYGVPFSTPSFGGFAHFDDVAQNTDASAMVANLTHAWSLTATPYVQQDLRYATMINGAEPSYFVVADDIQKDNSNHSYEWYLHTGLGNSVSASGNKATMTGANGNATMDVYSLGPASRTWSTSISTVGNLGDHTVLKDSASSTTDPYFFHLLIPTATGATTPTVTNSSQSNGRTAIITWLDGAEDTVLWRTGSGAISANGVTSDGRLTIVRQKAGSVTGLVVIAGRSVTLGSTTLLSVGDGSAPVTVSAFGPTATLYATDASQLQLGLPFVTGATLEDGAVSVPVTSINGIAYISGGLPLGAIRRGNGLRYAVDYNDNYTHDLQRYNHNHPAVERFGIVNGAQELLATTADWPSFNRRDSTAWRRSGLFPSLIPPIEHGDADFAFRFKFNGALDTDNTLRVYLRTVDRDPADFEINQDYVRLDLIANQGSSTVNQISLGQRVNGAWSSQSDNDTLTSSLPPASATSSDGNWHNVKVRLLGDVATVWFDGAQVITGTLATTIPTAPASGYVQWKVIGSTPVLIDDFTVNSIDLTPPVAPTDGTVTIQPDGTGAASAVYDHGMSTDAQTLSLYESATPILPSTDPSTLHLVASSSNPSGLTLSGADRTIFHALGVADPAGNKSPLLPLSVDLIPPATVSDLQAQ